MTLLVSSKPSPYDAVTYVMLYLCPKVSQEVIDDDF